MDSTEKKVFRKSLLGGFSKEDVNKYIAESTEKYTAQIKDIEEKYLAADKEREELSKKLREAEEKISELTKKSEELDALTPKHTALTAEHGDALAKLTSCEEKCASLSERVAALEKIEAEYSARKTELADIEIAARARASEIINEAEAEACRKRTELDNELALRRRDFQEKKDAELRETGDAVAGISRLVDSLKSEVDSMDSRITRIADAVRNNVTSLADAVCDAQCKVAGIKDRLAADDEQKGNC